MPIKNNIISPESEKMEQPKRSFESPWLMIMPALFVILVAFLYSILL